MADENGGKWDNRVVFYWDEIGTIQKIESAEMMFSASGLRRGRGYCVGQVDYGMVHHDLCREHLHIKD